MMPAKPGIGFKVWTTTLSVFVAVILFLNIIRKHGPVKSLLFAVLAVAVIWVMYFVIGRILNGAVATELKRRSAEQDARDRDAGPGSAGDGREE